MRARVKGRWLGEVLKLAGEVAERRGTIPILGMVKLEAWGDAGGVVRFTATNLDTTLEVVSSAQVDEPGAVVLWPHELKDYARGSGKGERSGEVTLGPVDSERWLCAVEGGGCAASLECVNPEDYPAAFGTLGESAVDPSENASALKRRTRVLAAEVLGLKRAAERCWPVGGKHDARYYLLGGRLRVWSRVGSAASAVAVELAATDGHTLIWDRTREVDEDESEVRPEEQLLVAREALAVLARLPEGVAGVEVSLVEEFLEEGESSERLPTPLRALRFNGWVEGLGSWVLTTRIKDDAGRFPSYDRLRSPRGMEERARANREVDADPPEPWRVLRATVSGKALLAALGQVRTLVKDRTSKPVKVEWYGAETLRVTTQAVPSGATASVQVGGGQGDATGQALVHGLWDIDYLKRAVQAAGVGGAARVTLRTAAPDGDGMVWVCAEGEEERGGTVVCGLRE